VSSIPLPPLGLPFGKPRPRLEQQMPAIEAMLRPLGKDGGNGSWGHWRKAKAAREPEQAAAPDLTDGEPLELDRPPAPPTNEQLRVQAAIESHRALQQAANVLGSHGRT
jgi:hypothetical protein